MTVPISPFEINNAVDACYNEFSEDEFEAVIFELEYDWEIFARTDQLPPQEDWNIWLLLGGRGSGKTRAGADWVRQRVKDGARHVAIVAPTHNDGREVMLGGESGLLNIGPQTERPIYLPSRRLLLWPNGARGHLFSAEEPERLRGPQFDTAWMDEFCAMEYPQETLDNLRLALRLTTAIGSAPQLTVTTTPKPGRALRDLINAKGCVVTKASTAMNADNLAPGFLDMMQDRFGGTRLGRQELNGEFIEDPPGALFPRSLVEDNVDYRAPHMDEFNKIIIAIDPPISSGPNANACGIIVAGVMGEGRAAKVWIIKDASVQGKTPTQWALQAIRNWRHYKADHILVESNQGGEMVETVIRTVAPATPIVNVHRVHASRSKAARAEPVAALYEQGRVKHADDFAELTDELCRLGANDKGPSPDRADALVWAVTDLLVNARDGPGIRFFE